MLFDEAYINRALARVCNDEGATLGTAFFSQVDPGVALTCDHLVPTASKPVLLDCGDGQLRPGTVAADDRFPDLDLAIIRGVEAPPTAVPLPIAAEHQGISRFWTKGFHYHGREITDALPTNGEIEGETSTSFPGFSRDYHLNHVLMLRTNVIDAGLSGAPVIDPETGVAFALVNAKFRAGNLTAGLALPFAQAVATSEKLKRLLSVNGDLIPRYGRFLNRLGALEICRGQRERVFSHLSSRDVYLRDMYCERAEQSDIVDFYSDKDALILPIIGNAGVGKTMLLAEVASREQSKATVLLLGRSLRPEDTELSIAVTTALRDSSGDLLTARGDVSLLINALRRAGDRLTVIFDGLNEITSQTFPSLQGWIDRSVTWLVETNTRLIVSSRPEFWETFASLFPRKRVFSKNSADPQRKLTLGTSLGDFTKEEATEVRELYHLNPSIETRHIQHPLMARIYWELQTELNQRQFIGITRYQALQRFISQKNARIARATGLLSAHVESYLRDAAGRTLATGGFEIENQEFFALFSGNAVLADQFVSEGLFMTTSQGMRFTFDEIGEFLQSWQLDLDTILHLFSPGAETPRKLTVGAITYAILRFNEEGKDEFVERATKEVFRARNRKATSLMAENVLVQLVQELRNPERFTAEIKEVTAELARNPIYHSEWYDRFGFRLALARSALSLEFKLNLLRPFLLKEDSYDFEYHHWHDLERYVIKSRGHTGRILAELIQSAPVAAFEIMVGWLSDETRLREAKSTVAHAAMALMFLNRHLAFGPLCEVVARSETEKAGILLRFLSESDPAEMLVVCRQWIDRNDPILLSRAANLAWLMAGHEHEGEREDKLYEVFTGALGRVDLDVDAVAKVGIGRLRKYRATVVEDLLSLFRNGAAEVDGYGISELSDTNFEQIVQAIKEVLPLNPERAAETISALCRQPRSEADRTTLIELMYLGADQGLSQFFSFRFGLEYLLTEVHSDADVDRVLALAKYLLHKDEQTAINLTYFACANTKDDIYERRLQDQLLELLIASDIDDDKRQGVINLLAANSRNRVGDLTNFQAISRRMSRRQFHRFLFGAAFQYLDFAEILVDWLERPDGLSPVGPTKIFLDIVHQGHQPHEAARQLMDEFMTGDQALG